MTELRVKLKRRQRDGAAIAASAFDKPFTYRGVSIAPPARADRARVRELYEAMKQVAERTDA